MVVLCFVFTEFELKWVFFVRTQKCLQTKCAMNVIFDFWFVSLSLRLLYAVCENGKIALRDYYSLIK